MDDEKLEREAAKMLFSAPAAPEVPAAPAQPVGSEIAFVCPFCGEAYQVSEELAGKKITCRNCREPVRVDAKKPRQRGAKALPFWLGIVVGVAAATLIVIVLKLARIL
jgi:hypothetical protein